jgi:hypothetical protein
LAAERLVYAERLAAKFRRRPTAEPPLAAVEPIAFVK